MSELVVVSFPDPFKADEVLAKLLRLQREHLIDLEDACVVVRTADGKVKLKQMHNLLAYGTLSGGMWGALIGLLFLNPLAGILAGGAAGALGGALSDVGIDDDFIKEVGQTIEPGSSAIFVLVRRATTDKVLAEFQGYGGRVLRSSLTVEDERRLQEVLEERARPAAETAAAPADVASFSATGPGQG